MDFVASLAAQAAQITARCTQCGRCVEACPMPGPAGIDIADSGAIAAGVVAMMASGEAPEKSLAWVSACSGNGDCIDACQDGVNPRFMIKLARLAQNKKRDIQTIRADGKARFQKMARSVRVISRLQLTTEELFRLTRAPRQLDSEPDPNVVFYTGCNVLKTPHIALLCLDVMDRIGARYAVFGGPSNCCGILQMRAGDAASAGRQGGRTLDRFFGTGADEVLSWCPTCDVQLGEAMLPSQPSNGAFGMTMFSVYLARKLDALKEHFVHRVEKRVGLHEHSGTNGVTASVRTLLRAIPGLEFVELDQPAAGYACTALAGTPDFKRDLHAEQLRAAEAAGVTTLAGIYHSCHRDFCAHEREWPFEVVNFMELIGEAMGLYRPDLFKRLKLMQDVDAVIAECGDMIERHKLDRDEVRDVILNDMFGEQTLLLDRSLIS